MQAIDFQQEKFVHFKPWNQLARRSEIKIIILILEPFSVDCSL